MAVLERPLSNRIGVDDTDQLKCTIENAHTLDGHTEYCVRVQRPGGSDTWRVCHRYSEFAALHSALKPADVRLPFPPKKIIGNMNPEFIAERRNALQLYLDALVNNYILAYSLPVRVFLDPKNYSNLSSETALQNVSMALRGDGNFELKSPLPDVGWRIRKHYYLVSKFNADGEDYIMSWQTYGPDRVMCERDMQTSFKCLMNMKHPYIDKIVFIHCLETGVYVIRKLHNKGSVKDELYGAQYKNSFLSKYINPKHSKPFTAGQIAHYGYQILQTLKFLHDKGFPYGHLHTGNLVIENHKILLMDIENCILGVPMYLRPLLLKHKKICSMEDIDVYNFGHVLYELAFGHELTESMCESFPYHECDELVSVLNMILTPNKLGMPKIETLLSQPFFKSTLPFDNISDSCSSHVKFSAAVKEQLKLVCTSTEQRIKNDQKKVLKEKKLVRIQEILSSSDGFEKKRLKKVVRENDFRNAYNEPSKSSEAPIVRSRSLNGLSVSNAADSGERSGSVASTSSTVSSHNSPYTNVSPQPDTSSIVTPPSSSNNRTMLLDSIRNH